VTRPLRPWWKPRRSRLQQRIALAIVVVLVTVAALQLWRVYSWVVAYPDRPGSQDSEPMVVEIPTGATFPAVLALLVEEGVIPKDEAMYFRAFVLHEGAARRTTAGTHIFRPNMTPREVLVELARRPSVKEVRITIPEGKNILEIAAALADAGLGTRESLLAAMRDRAWLDKLGIPGESVEGYLFPDTYKFGVEAPPKVIIERMVKRHREIYADLRRRHRDGARDLESDLGWGDHQVVVLASIVEKETGADHERPIIAGVFLNRLRFSRFTPKLLQTDPTIVYGCTVPEHKSEACQQFEGRIRRIHLRDKDNPYSTYAHEGLPPGPISNPGRDALEAVLSPKKSQFLFFVARNDGTHQFSKSVAEHEEWVERYQRQGQIGDGSAKGSVDPG